MLVSGCRFTARIVGASLAGLGLVAALLCVSAVLPAAAAAYAGWNYENSGTYNGLGKIAFADATHGWAVGDAGTIVATTDGSATWTAQNSGTTNALSGVAFSDSDHGWAVGQYGTIIATTDGGATWTPQSSPTTNWLDAVAFSDAKHGWAVGWSGTIIATTDGGTTWTSETAPTATDYLYGVYFSDAEHGWAVGYGIIATTDGGATWTQQSTGPGYNLNGVAFSDALHGWAVGDNGTIMATTDGGATWTTQNSSPSQRFVGVACSDAQHAWAVGDNTVSEGGLAIATTDGGATWGANQYGGPALYGVAFVNSNDGWVSGESGTIEGTTDGGVPAPALSSFNPGRGLPGTAVTLSGDGFTGATAVKFNGVAATFTVNSDSQITTSVPAGATSGPISITVADGSVVASSSSFTVLAPPTISSFAPASAAVGSTVTVKGTGFMGGIDMQVSFGGTAATFTFESPTLFTTVVPAGATNGPIKVTTAGGTVTSATSFTVVPTFTGFSPTIGSAGMNVVLSGTGLTGTDAVSFNGTPASFTVVGPNEIFATVPAGATSGPISIHTPGTTVTSAASFTVVPVLTITSFSPASGPVGSTVIVRGSGFTLAESLSFHGDVASFVVDSDSTISATVPDQATTGAISVTSPGGEVLSATQFTVTAATTPVNTALPAISGGPEPGNTLSCSIGTWTGSPTPTYSLQWLRGGTAISGATKSTYLVLAADQGKTLSCRVTAKNSAGSASVVSKPLAIPASAPTLTLKTSASSVKRGGSVTLSGVVKNIVSAYKSVVISKVVSGKLTKLESLTASSTGSFSYKWATTSTTATGSWVFEATYTIGTMTYKSVTVTVKVS